MTRSLDREMSELRETLLRMGSRAEAILLKALRAALGRDHGLAEEVARDDLAIDRLDVLVDELVLRALATQQPVAEDLRSIVASKMIATDLERVGDLSRNIAKSAERLCEASEAPLAEELSRLARATQSVLRSALDAFSEADVRKAREVLDADDAIDALQDEIVLSSIAEIQARPEIVSQAIDVILIAKNLERVADHATNIAEDVILAAEAKIVKHADKLGGSDAGRSDG